MSRFPSLDLGPLPVDQINATLGTEMEAGNVRLSSIAHRHIARDYPACLAALTSGAVQKPTYIGQDPSHAGNFVIVKRIARADGKGVLVAIGLEPSRTGEYNVRSSDLINATTVDVMRRAGRLRIPRLR